MNSELIKEMTDRYSSMSVLDFDNIDESDLTDEAKVIYEKEFAKRQTSEWREAEKQRVEKREKEITANSELKNQKNLLSYSRALFFFIGLLIIHFISLTYFLINGERQVFIAHIPVVTLNVLIFLLLTIFGLLYRTRWSRIFGITYSIFLFFSHGFVVKFIGCFGFFCLIKAKALFGPNKKTHSSLVNEFKKKSLSLKS